MLATFLPWKRNVFLDCGGNNGSSVRKFRKEFDPRARFHIFSFEPNPIYAERYLDIPKHKLIAAAVHNRDGETQFYLDREDGDGSTLFKNKLTRENGGYGVLDLDEPTTVKSIDLSAWIARELEPSDNIVLKLDVEGAEYDIIEKMAQDKTLSRISKLFIEWHWQKVGVTEERHLNSEALLRAAKVPFEDWDAKDF